MIIIIIIIMYLLSSYVIQYNQLLNISDDV